MPPGTPDNLCTEQPRAEPTSELTSAGRSANIAQSNTCTPPAQAATLLTRRSCPGADQKFDPVEFAPDSAGFTQLSHRLTRARTASTAIASRTGPRNRPAMIVHMPAEVSFWAASRNTTDPSAS